ncbi:MAG: 2Fe-2S iron-sulfur cluster-binding protein [Gemmatimonadota bacterium]
MSPAQPSSPAVHVRFLPSGIAVDIPQGAFLTLAAIRAGAPVVHDCDGQGVCGTCRVLVSTGGGALSPVEGVERCQLGADVDRGWRLCCRARVYGDVVVRVNPEGFAYPPELQRRVDREATPGSRSPARRRTRPG